VSEFQTAPQALMPQNMNSRNSHVASSYKDFLEEAQAVPNEQKSPEATFTGSFKRDKLNSDLNP
jgi:hypothetical protein